MTTAKKRELPAHEVEELIAFYCKSAYPPSIKDLEAMLQRFKFDVIYFQPETLPAAMTDHNIRQVWIPSLDEAIVQRMLIHEAAEVLLSLELAPQYQALSADALHKTAEMVELRAERSRLARTARETRRQMDCEAKRAIECIESVQLDPRRVRTAPVHPAAQNVERLAEQLVETEERIERLSAELEDDDF